MSERGLGAVLTKRFSRLTWTALAGYALLVVVVFALAAEAVLRHSLEHTADVAQSLIGAYGDSTGGPGEFRGFFQHPGPGTGRGATTASARTVASLVRWLPMISSCRPSCNAAFRIRSVGC